MYVWVSTILSTLFVLLGGFNVWLMLATRRTGRLAIRVHRTAGYLFVSIYALMFCYMGLRWKDVAGDLTPQLVVHISLALLLLPLLLAEVLIARYQKALIGVLRAPGIAILSMSFTLVRRTKGQTNCVDRRRQWDYSDDVNAALHRRPLSAD